MILLGVITAVLGLITVFSPKASAGSGPVYLRWTSNEIYCFSDPGDSGTGGTQLDMEACHTNVLGTQWGLRFIKSANGVNWYEFYNNKNVCIERNTFGTNNPLFVFPCNGGDDQLFDYGYNSSHYSMWVGGADCNGCEVIALHNSNLNDQPINETTYWNQGNTDQETCLTYASINDQVVPCRN
jgi:hypothetical protein